MLDCFYLSGVKLGHIQYTFERIDTEHHRHVDLRHYRDYFPIVAAVNDPSRVGIREQGVNVSGRFAPLHEPGERVVHSSIIFDVEIRIKVAINVRIELFRNECKPFFDLNAQRNVIQNMRGEDKRPTKQRMLIPHLSEPQLVSSLRNRH